MNAPKAPVAIRITRPYQTEEEFFAKELDTISRTGVTLVGAQQRPEGMILRFELALASGVPLLRGEGRVVGYRSVPGAEPGLSLRFTRLDSKSKSLVDRVVGMREARRSIPPPAASGELPQVPLAPASVPELKPEPPPLAPAVAVAPGPARAAPNGEEREAMLARLRERRARVNAEEILRLGAQRRKAMIS